MGQSRGRWLKAGLFVSLLSVLCAGGCGGEEDDSADSRPGDGDGAQGSGGSGTGTGGNDPGDGDALDLDGLAANCALESPAPGTNCSEGGLVCPSAEGDLCVCGGVDREDDRPGRPRDAAWVCYGVGTGVETGGAGGESAQGGAEFGGSTNED